MSRNVGQFAGEIDPYDDLLRTVRANAANTFQSISKIGIQLEEGKKIYIDGVEFEMGKTGILEFDNVDINSSIYITQGNRKTNDKIPVIVDYIYMSREEE